MESKKEEKTPILITDNLTSPAQNKNYHTQASKYQKTKKPDRNPIVVWVSLLGASFLVRVDKIRKGIFHIYEKACIGFLITTKQCAINPNLRINHPDYHQVCIMKTEFHCQWPDNLKLPKTKRDITVYMQFYFAYYKEYHCANLIEFLTRNKVIRTQNKFFKTKSAILNVPPKFLLDITYVVYVSKNNCVVKTLSLNLTDELNLTENTKLMFGEIAI
jgi:hypothetical protein